MQNNLGETICRYRQLRKLTQEEFARRLGVTPQAVSKWERGNGLPDASLLGGICTVLEIDANVLLGITENIVENGDVQAESEVHNNLIAAPLVVEIGEELVPMVLEGLGTGYVDKRRKELAKETGMLMPRIQIMDNEKLPSRGYCIKSYDRIICEGEAEADDKEEFCKLIDKMEDFCRTHYADILNKQLVRLLINNLKAHYPGVADGLIPERISYLACEKALRARLAKGESIRNLIRIVEEMEEDL